MLFVDVIIHKKTFSVRTGALTAHNRAVRSPDVTEKVAERGSATSY